MRRSPKSRKRSNHRKRTGRRNQRILQTARQRRKTARHARADQVVPRTPRQYLAMSRRSQEIWDRVSQVPGLMRSGKLSLNRASKEIGLSPRLVRRLVSSALRRKPSGRYVARRIDHLLRSLLIPGDKGLLQIFVRDSRQSSLIGEYWAALDRYLIRGDASRLEKFRKRRIRPAQGKSILLLTDLDELKRQASAGVLRFESLYGRTV